MRLRRCSFIGTIVLSAGILVGCDSSSTGMKNMKLSEGKEGSGDVSVKSKKGGNIKEVPPLPPEGVAPPLKKN
jgi:hypothetical protein